jgi:hypothetical protein
VEEGRERVAQCWGMTLATPHSTRTAPGMAAQWQVVRTAPGPNSQAASGDRHGEDSPFDPDVCGMSGHLMLRSGGVGEVPRAEGRPRAMRRSARGAPTPRVRRKFTARHLSVEWSGGSLKGDWWRLFDGPWRSSGRSGLFVFVLWSVLGGVLATCVDF